MVAGVGVGLEGAAVGEFGADVWLELFVSECQKVWIDRNMRGRRIEKGQVPPS
jgi:hypothetical protein